MKKLIFIFTITVLVSGCFLFTSEEEIDKMEYIELNSGRTVEYLNTTEVSIYIEGTSLSEVIKRSLAKRKKEKAEIGYIINHLIRLKPVEVDGEKVQANDIIIKSNTAYVAYNTADEVFRGAIQVIDISKGDEMVINQEIIFKNMDINRLYIDGNSLLFGGAADPDVYESRSFFGKIDNISNLSVDDIENNLTFFEKSYGVTGITKKGGKYYFGVGAEDGGIYVVDANSGEELVFIARSDIRDLNANESYIVGLAGITDADIATESAIVYLKNESYELDEDRTIPVGFDDGEESAYHKATIEVEGNTAYLGLVHQGMGILDMTDNSLEKISNPTVTTESGIKPYTNSVSLEGNLIFSANGEYGFRIFDKNNTEVLGYRPFESGIDGNPDENGQKYSANHIEYKSNYIFVASGEGGVNVYSVKKDE